jgi:uncharacterized repeat protein (TIGR01451 family)
MSSHPRLSRLVRHNFPFQPYRCLLICALFLGGQGWLWLRPAIGQTVPEASPTPGTVIENQSTGSYLDDSDLTDKAIESDRVILTVAEVAGITVVGTQVSEAPAGVANAGNLQGNGTINTSDIAYFDYTITNVGNDPTQFFIPDTPASVIGGTFDKTNNPIQIIAYKPPGASSIDITGVTVPTGGSRTGPSTATGTDGLLGKNGMILPGGSVTIRVPIKVTVTNGQPVTVVMGNTAPNDNSIATQNQVYTNNSNQDIYTQDNPDGTTNPAGTVVETKDPPLNGDTTNHRQEASASQSTTVIGLDFGDAPDPGAATGPGNYRTTASDGGPSHAIVPGLSLGTTVDADAGTWQNANADADNGDDGVTSFPSLIPTPGKTYTVSVNVTNTTGQTAYLVGYIDFNQNGDFSDPDEKSATVSVTASGTYNVTLTIPAGIKAGGTTYARFRLGSTQTEVESSVGAAASGEVEDYKLPIAGNPNVLLVKRITAINGGTTTIGGDALKDYIDDPINPYDDNEITIPTQPNPTDPQKDTDKWPNTIGSTSSTFLIGGINGGFLKPKDSIEYTIYFLSAGDSTAKSVLFCDRVPSNVTFIPHAYNSVTANPSGLSTADRGIAISFGSTLTSYTNINDGDIAQYFPPGIEPSTIYPNINCGKNASGQSLPNDHGAVVVNLKNLPNATGTKASDDAAGAYGFVRFQGLVN